MGLFSKKTKEPVVHPAVERTVYVPAAVDGVVAHLEEYSTLFSSRHAAEHRLGVASSGDWSAVRLPDAVHPWQLHNLAYWMLDCPGVSGDVIAESGKGPGHPGYHLVRDPEIADALCGWDLEGNGWTVQVPGNDIARNEAVPVPQAISCPSGFSTWREVVVNLEEPGHRMNPRNESNARSRKQLAKIGDDVIAW